jgi:hypothetical protein
VLRIEVLLEQALSAFLLAHNAFGTGFKARIPLSKLDKRQKCTDLHPASLASTLSFAVTILNAVAGRRFFISFKDKGDVCYKSQNQDKNNSSNPYQTDLS